MSINPVYQQLGDQIYRKICYGISGFFFRCLPTIITLAISTVTCAELFHSSVERISTNSALPDITIYSLLEDDSGFLWLGTPKGLVRYDGNQFQVYSRNSDNSVTLQSNDSSNIFIDSKQRMWIGTWGEGLYLYDNSMNFIAHFVHNVEDQHSISSHFIQALFEDSDGNIWVGTNGGGLSIYNNEFQNFTNFINDPGDNRSLSNNRVWSISESAGKVIWVATTHGLNRFVLKEPGIFTRYHHDDNNRYSLDGSLIRSLLVDKKGNLWVGTESGFGLFDIETERFTRINPSENQSLAPITRIREDKEGNIWIGTQKGIYRYEPDNKKYTALVSDQNYNMFPRDDIRDIVIDNSGLLWVSTRYAGLIRLKFAAKTFNEYNSFESVSGEIEDFSNVTAMVEDHDGVLWLGSSEGLLFRKGMTDKFHKHNDKSVFTRFRINTLVEDIEQTLWIGGAFGLYSLDKDRETLTNRNDLIPDSANKGVSKLLIDTNGIMWIGTKFQGLIRVENDTSTIFQHDKNNSTSLSQDSITVLFEDDVGRLWIGTPGSGVNRLDPRRKRFFQYSHDNNILESLSHNIINDIYQSADGAIWIATKQGLDKLNEVSDSFDHFDETDGMASSDIRSILEDDLGNLWLSSVKGLIQYKQQSEYFVNYDKSNRLQGSIYLGASAKSDSGALFFGAIEGLIQVSASNLQNNTHVPKTVITNVWLDDKPIIQYDFPADEPLKLHYKVRSIKIQFAALDFQQSNNNMYSSYLQGFDQDYNMPNHKISAHYTNLSPGRYVFHVKGSNNSGVWSTNDATLEIIITPPWWGVLWIQILLVLSVLGVFYAWHRVRLITLARDKKQLELMVQENSEQLVAAQKQLVESEKNVAISGLVVGVAHEINTPIGISVTAVSHTMQLVDTLLASINNNKLSRTDLINKMENIKIGTELASNNLDRVSEIIHSFKMISVDQSSENRRQFNFLQCLDAIIISLNSQFKKANVTINLSCPDDIDIDSYPGTIIQIVNSLVSNALNHAFDGSQENAAISIIVKQDERWIVMDISDNGIGVDDNKLKRIFEPFFTSKRGKGFTGLGLHVVSNLVTFRLGGKITCTSKNGNGCQFNLKFLAEP